MQATPVTKNAYHALQSAALQHLPVEPNQMQNLPLSKSGDQEKLRLIPTAQSRKPISLILDEITNMDWYKGQIVRKKHLGTKVAKTGKNDTADICQAFI